MLRVATCLMSVVLACLLSGGCHSKQDADPAAEKGLTVAPEHEGKLMVLSLAMEGKTASDPLVGSILDGFIRDLRSPGETDRRVGAARGLGAAAECGLIGSRSRTAKEALYKASVSDSDKAVQSSAAEALKLVEDYRKGTVPSQYASIFEDVLKHLSDAAPSSRRSAVDALRKAAVIGKLGVYVDSAQPALERMAREDSDEGVQKAAADALRDLEDYRATLDLPARPSRTPEAGATADAVLVSKTARMRKVLGLFLESGNPLDNPDICHMTASLAQGEVGLGELSLAGTERRHDYYQALQAAAKAVETADYIVANRAEMPSIEMRLDLAKIYVTRLLAAADAWAASPTDETLRSLTETVNDYSARVTKLREGAARSLELTRRARDLSQQIRDLEKKSSDAKDPAEAK